MPNKNKKTSNGISSNAIFPNNTSLLYANELNKGNINCNILINNNINNLTSVLL